MVARRRALLVAGLVFLVHHDRAEALDRREHRRARAYRDESFAAAQRAPGIGALPVRQARVEHRHAVSKDAAHPRHGLRRQGDLGHEQDCPISRLHHGTKQVEIDECLAGARHPMN